MCPSGSSRHTLDGSATRGMTVYGDHEGLVCAQRYLAQLFTREPPLLRPFALAAQPFMLADTLALRASGPSLLLDFIHRTAEPSKNERDQPTRVSDDDCLGCLCRIRRRRFGGACLRGGASRPRPPAERRITFSICRSISAAGGVSVPDRSLAWRDRGGRIHALHPAKRPVRASRRPSCGGSFPDHLRHDDRLEIPQLSGMASSHLTCCRTPWPRARIRGVGARPHLRGATLATGALEGTGDGVR